MGFLDWSERYSVYIEHLDEQHRYLFDLINRFHELASGRQDRNKMYELLDRFIEYSVEHFGAEEELFAKYNYPEIENHKKEHERFRREISDLKEQALEDKNLLCVDVLDYLCGWVIKHVAGLDRRYSDFLNQRGVR